MCRSPFTRPIKFRIFRSFVCWRPVSQAFIPLTQVKIGRTSPINNLWNRGTRSLWLSCCGAAFTIYPNGIRGLVVGISERRSHVNMNCPHNRKNYFSLHTYFFIKQLRCNTQYSQQLGRGFTAVTQYSIISLAIYLSISFSTSKSALPGHLLAAAKLLFLIPF